MKLPNLSSPVQRENVAKLSSSNGVKPSGACGCANACEGACVFGKCLGYCH